MMQIGYTQRVNEVDEDIIHTTIESTDMPAVNAALSSLQSSMAGQANIIELFVQEYCGEDDDEGNRIYKKFVITDMTE